MMELDRAGREQALVKTFRDLTVLVRRLQKDLEDDAQTRHWVALDGHDLPTLVGDGVTLNYGVTELTRTAPGLIGCRPQTLALAKTVNTLKTLLTQQVLDLREDKGAAAARQRARELFAEAGSPRISLRQAYRHLLLLDAAPVQIGFTYARAHRSIRLLSMTEASALIDHIFSKPEDHARALGLLSAHRHVPIYQVYPASLHLRANLLWADGRRQIRQAHSVLLYPAEPGSPPPFYRVPKKTPMPRLPRADIRIAREPLIAHTPIHLGLPDHLGSTP